MYCPRRCAFYAVGRCAKGLKGVEFGEVLHHIGEIDITQKLEVRRYIYIYICIIINKYIYIYMYNNIEYNIYL